MGIPGNEMADSAAKEAAGAAQGPGSGVSLGSTVAHIRRTVGDPSTTHPRLMKTYKDISHKQEGNTRLTRKDAVLLARLRSGHWEALRGYKHMLDPSTDSDCRRCGYETEDVEHIFTSCPATHGRRYHTFGPDNDLDVLTRDPTNSMALARWFIST